MNNESVCMDVSNTRFLIDVKNGLSQPQKTVPSKYFYDEVGSVLFEKICELEEYYPTRTELKIMERHAEQMAECVGPEHVVVELGSGSSLKTRILLKTLERPAAYVPFDISQSALDDAVKSLSEDIPNLPVFPVCGDFMEAIRLPKLPVSFHGSVTYFPGSTIGNLPEEKAVSLLQRIRRIDEDSDLLIGIDLEKDREVLLAAYNDKVGTTSEFNLNLLHRINSELGANFDVEQFAHEAVFNEKHHRIEMHLVSQTGQDVDIDGEKFHFDQGETICTEYSHKYSIERFAELVAKANYEIAKMWTDENDWFAVLLLKPSKV